MTASTRLTIEKGLEVIDPNHLLYVNKRCSTFLCFLFHVQNLRSLSRNLRCNWFVILTQFFHIHLACRHTLLVLYWIFGLQTWSIHVKSPHTWKSSNGPELAYKRYHTNDLRNNMKDYISRKRAALSWGGSIARMRGSLARYWAAMRLWITQWHS
jgi:hypothetical protein